ncbi:hypothetical protein DFP72DRAFT_850603, partial [Ephemerocybe angulata]
ARRELLLKRRPNPRFLEEVVTVVKEGEDATGKVVAVLENTETSTAAQEKSLPSPPPTAAVSIAKVGQLAACRVVQPPRSGLLPPHPWLEPQAKSEAKGEGSEKEVKESAENDGGEAAPVVEGEAPATEEAKKDAEAAVPPVEDTKEVAEAKDVEAAAAGSSAWRVQIYEGPQDRETPLRSRRRLVQADKSEVVAGTNDATIEIKPVEEATGKVEAKEAEGRLQRRAKRRTWSEALSLSPREGRRSRRWSSALHQGDRAPQGPPEVGRSRLPRALRVHEQWIRGKHREKDDVVAGSEGVTSAGPSKDGMPGLGKRFLQGRCGWNLWGLRSPKGEPHSTKAGDKLRTARLMKIGEAGAVQGKGGEEVIDIGNAKSEGAAVPRRMSKTRRSKLLRERLPHLRPQKKDETTTEAKEGKGGLSAPISSLVHRALKQKQKSPTDKPLPPTDGQQDHESPRASVDEKGGKRRRRLSLGFRSKKKVRRSMLRRLETPNLLPKDAEVEKGLPEPPSNVGVGEEGGDIKAEEAVKETEPQAEPVEEVSTDKPQATTSA